MSRTGNNEQFDTDILQCKADILRARRTIQLPDDTAPENPETQSNSDTAEVTTRQDTDSIPIEAIPAKENPHQPRLTESPDEKEKSEEASEIPKFDLAEEIMAEQRKTTAIRRKAPGGKPEIQRLKPEVQPVEHINEKPKPELSEQEKIIAEIVARDIERLCRGDYSGE